MKFPVLLALLAVAVGFLLLYSSCKHDHDKEHHAEGSHESPDHHDHESHEDHDHHGDANEHMHKTPFEELVKRFESPERDAYQQPEKVLAFLGDVKGKRILDIGAGTGYFTFRLAKADARVTAGDVDDQFLNFIYEKIKNEGLEELGILPKKLPYDDPMLEKGGADMVIVVNTYHHIEDRSDYFAKVLNGLSENGELIIIDFFKKELPVGPPPGHKIAADVVVDELKKAGFTRFEVNDSLLEYQFLIRAR